MMGVPILLPIIPNVYQSNFRIFFANLFKLEILIIPWYYDAFAECDVKKTLH